MKNTEKDNSNKELIPIEKLTKYVACLTALVTIMSILSTVLIKFISFGRCLYFDFDIDYYDFSLSGSIIFVFVITLVCVLIALIESVILIKAYIWCKKQIDKIKLKIKTKNLSCKNKEKKRKENFINQIIEAITFGVLYILEMIITYFLSKIIIPKNEVAMFVTVITSLLVFTIISMIYMVWSESKKQNIKYIAIAAIVLLSMFTLVFMYIEYKKAEEETKFPIITYEQEYYVVISEGKTRYSAYKCEIIDEFLHIITFRHKYFDIDSTDTELVDFKKKPELKEQESISPAEFLEKDIELNSTGD